MSKESIANHVHNVMERKINGQRKETEQDDSITPNALVQASVPRYSTAELPS